MRRGSAQGAPQGRIEANDRMVPGFKEPVALQDGALQCQRRAVILAGGRGARLLPYTVVLPKPLMPIGDYPILEVIVRQLAKQGFERLTLAVSHQAHLIQAFFQKGQRWGIEIDYSLEEQPLSTIAPLALIPDLPDDFLLMNGDVLTDLSMRNLLDQHSERESLFTIASATREQVTDYGVLQVDETSRLIGFEEKPRSQYLVSMGVYAVSRRVLRFVPPGRPFRIRQPDVGTAARGRAR